MVTDRAYALLTQSVSDVIGDETKIATALSNAVKSGSPLDLMMAKASFDNLDAALRQQVHGRAVHLAQGATVH
jgi:hypothetical protein